MLFLFYVINLCADIFNIVRKGLPVENMQGLAGERMKRERTTFIKPGKSQNLTQEVKGMFQ